MCKNSQWCKILSLKQYQNCVKDSKTWSKRELFVSFKRLKLCLVLNLCKRRCISKGRAVVSPKKTNERIYFSILTTPKILQSSGQKKQIRPFVFWEELWLYNFVSRSTDLQVLQKIIAKDNFSTSLKLLLDLNGKNQTIENLFES